MILEVVVIVSEFLVYY